MTLVRSNIAWVEVGKQSVKGTPVAAGAAGNVRTRVSSNDRFSPREEFTTFPETDSQRDAPNSEKLTGGAEGSFQAGVRDSIFHRFAELALGDRTTTGATNFTHTSVGATNLPYFTALQDLGDVLYEKYEDLVVDTFSVNVEAGGFMTCSLAAQGRTVTRSATAYTPLATLANDALYTFNDAAVTVGGVATAQVRSFGLTLENNIQMLQTDDFVPYDVAVGQRVVTVNFDMLFEDLNAYNVFHYGTTSGTTQAQTTPVTDVDFLFTKSVNNSIEFDLDSVNYEEFPVGPDTGGDPIIVSARVRARRSGTQLLKIVTSNQSST